jgi:tRNA wybutosine-synthesizing protein 1
MNKKAIDEPSEIINELIKAQRLLLTGFKGNEKADKKKWGEAQNPTNAALSLIGDSILYPRFSELLEEFHKRSFSTFLVTKGTSPERLKDLEVEPTNLYISLCAPDEETYNKVDNPIVKDGWKRMNESLELMKSFDCRKILRLTLVKGLNMKNPEKYAKLILKTNCDFVEAKGFMWVGESQKRLQMNDMPYHEEIVEFAKKLSEFTGYEIKDEFKPSRVVLLSRK